MEQFQVAHIRKQGQDPVVVFVNSSMQYKTTREQAEIHSALQSASISAGLAGAVVLVWQCGSRMGFFCHTAFHAFFASVSYNVLAANINRTLRIAA